MNPEPINSSTRPTAKEHTGFLTLLFTDIVGSTALKQQLGEKVGARITHQHHQLVRDILREFVGAKEIDTAGDSFLISFTTPSAAVTFALLLQAKLRGYPWESPVAIQDRIGIHLGEVVIQEAVGGEAHLYGSHLDSSSRIMSLAKGGQVLLSRGVFDSARMVLKGEDLPGLGPLEWLNHGAYLLKGIEGAVEICEVREVGHVTLSPPTSSEKAQRQVRAEEEPVLGWRPAIGQAVPNTRWILESKLGEGGFGEVWLGRHQTMKERRVFKFCFQADRVRSLKREMTLFRLIKERIGDHPHIVSLREVNFDEPPFYVEMDYVAGQDLRSWCETQGGVAKVPLEAQLEIIAQIADGLQAAHDAGVVHRDVKPANILVSGDRQELVGAVAAKLTDFGIGQVLSEEYLAGVTRAGFTETLIGSGSSSQTGTQLYMAPELLAGQPASIQSDIYSLGVVLYQLIAGDFTIPVTMDWADRITDPLLREDLKRCFAGNPQQRFAGTGELASRLRGFPERRAELARQQAELAAREHAAYRRGIMRATGIAASLVIIFLVLAVVAFMQSRKARTESSRAEMARLRAETARQDTRRNLYASEVNGAYTALAENHLGRAIELMKRQIPARGEDDLRGFEWRYLWQQCQSDEKSSIEVGETWDMVYSPDGRILVSDSGKGHGGQITIRDTASNDVITNLPFNAATIAFSPRQPLLAASSRWQLGVMLWNTNTWSESRSFTNFTGPVRFSPDGRWFAAATTNGYQVWDAETWKVIGTCPGRVPNQYWIGNTLAFSPDGRFLVASVDISKQPTAFQCVFRVWKLPSLEPVENFHFERQVTSAVAWSMDGKHLLTGMYDGKLVVWDAATGQMERTERPHTAAITAIAVEPAGRTFITASSDGSVVVWNADTCEVRARLRGHQGEIRALAISPNGRQFATAGNDGKLKFWSPETRPAEDTLSGRGMLVGFTPESQRLVTYADKGLKIFRLDSKVVSEVLMESEATDYRDRPIAIAGSGPIAAVGRTNGMIEIWDLGTSQRQRAWKAHTNAILAIALSKDANLLAVSTAGDQLALWSLEAEPKLLRTIDSKRVYSIVFSPNGKMLATANEPPNQVWLWEVDGLREILHKCVWCNGLAFSPDGKFLAASDEGNAARLWLLPSGKLQAVFRGHLQALPAIAFSPDGQTFATGGHDRKVKLWHLATRQELATFSTEGPISAIQFSPDGGMLAASYVSENGETKNRLWRAPSLVEIDVAKQTLQADDDMVRGVSLAVGAKARASNVFHNDPGYGPNNAVDGDLETRWATDNGTRQVWLELELPKPSTFSGVVIHEWSGAPPRIEKFEVQYKEGGNWKTIFTGTTAGPNFKKRFAPVTAQVVRLNILDANDAPTIDEFELLK